MIEQGKKCSSPYHYRQQLHRHQYAPFNKFSCLQYRRSQRQAASGTHQQPNTTKNGIQPNIILIHTTQTKIKNLVHWHTIEFSDNNHTTSHATPQRCATNTVNGKSQNNLYIASGLFSYRHTHQNLQALSGALSVSLTHIKLHTHTNQHKSPA